VRTITNLLAMKVEPSAWVIELGTNDVGQYHDATQYGSLIDKVLALIPAEAPLVWVNVYRPQYMRHTTMFNMLLQQRIDQRGNAQVADWYSLASGKQQTILRSDHLHPNPHGEGALSLLVAQALQRL
jgi:lysophospholipase L1-like esterase